MEYGSFIELQFQKGKEWYKGKNVVRLNNGRAGIYHAFRVLECKKIYLPYYQCDTVRDFLIKKNVTIEYYNINEIFEPKIDCIEDEAAILIVNYYGIFSKQHMEYIAKKYKNVIVDNSQAFFCEPIEKCINVYSTRKFFGVPDGAYVVGENVSKYYDTYEQDYSSDTSLFLLQRIEYGCSGKAYESRMLNEKRIDDDEIKKMSKLTYTILDSIDYENVKIERRRNFELISKNLEQYNEIDVKQFYNDDVIPMVYPFLYSKKDLLPIFQKNKMFQGHWWTYLLSEIDSELFEYHVSKYITPITIDQRYNEKEMKKQLEIILNNL